MKQDLLLRRVDSESAVVWLHESDDYCLALFGHFNLQVTMTERNEKVVGAPGKMERNFSVLVNIFSVHVFFLRFAKLELHHRILNSRSLQGFFVSASQELRRLTLLCSLQNSRGWLPKRKAGEGIFWHQGSRLFL